MPKYLIVDDEPLIRKGLMKLISRVAPEWTPCGEAWNGLEGVQLATELLPDLILSDIRMPEMDGLDMARKLIELAVPVPVVFFTGHDEFAYVQTAIQNNAFDYLLKPIKEQDVRQLLDRYEREFGQAGPIRREDVSQIKQFEFRLQSAFEAGNAEMLEELENWYDRLKTSISLRTFVDLTTRTLQSFLLRHDMICAEFKPVINDTNASNVIRSLQAFCAAQLEETLGNRTNPLIRKVKDWVEERMEDNPSLAEAAELVHLSPTYFSEYFKKHEGETFQQYVVRVKVQRAKQLLEDPLLRVYDIASRVGYADHRHFSKVFQSKVGATPTEYRNRILGIAGAAKE
ncbi:response regulator transcription factor [Cohnella caldifontis]|uniref:response regulator transcription factor n=1 Tax=Cohnella caldifontis TaxID=3027471 RepID=UPI0023EB77CE|nr:response regulator [Cohnella sp. YIM B05605]